MLSLRLACGQEESIAGLARLVEEEIARSTLAGGSPEEDKYISVRCVEVFKTKYGDIAR